MYSHGKLIIKIDERRNLAILWIVMLILWNLFLIKDIKGYIRYNDLFYRNSIFQHIFWVEASIFNIIAAIKYSEIRENGIYSYGYFYKWHIHYLLIFLLCTDILVQDICFINNKSFNNYKIDMLE